MSAPLEVIAIRKLDGSGSVKAFLDLQLGGVTLKGCKIVQQDGKAPWLAMPAVKTERAWLNIVELSKELRQRVTPIAVEAWQRSLSLPPAPGAAQERGRWS